MFIEAIDVLRLFIIYVPDRTARYAAETLREGERGWQYILSIMFE